jgi:hypothetical protein
LREDGVPIYLILAYVVFCGVPLGFGIVTHLRLRRVTLEIESLENELGQRAAQMVRR